MASGSGESAGAGPAGVWPAGIAGRIDGGIATGVGSLPGTDVDDAQARVLELLPDLPHLVELPERGPGADMVGRGAALLTDLPVDLQPSGWRFVPRSGREVRRARDLLRRDLDSLAVVADGWTGPLKVQAAGPWTLAATVELARGDKALSDPDAVADIAASLADGLAAHLADLGRAVPGAQLLVQIDEPALAAVVAGHVPTASGFSVLRVPEAAEIEERLATVLAVLPHPGVHCCAADPPLALIRAAGARWLSLDATLLHRRVDDALGEALEAGTGLVLGVDPWARTPEQPARELAGRLGFAPVAWLRAVLLSPRCGLGDSGRSPEQAGQGLSAVGRASRRLTEQVAQ